MTYKETQKIYKDSFNRTIKTCWIADVKRILGLTTRRANNRINENSVKYPCPENIKQRIRIILNG